jgi:hypothetical protein
VIVDGIVDGGFIVDGIVDGSFIEILGGFLGGFIDILYLDILKVCDDLPAIFDQ